MCWLEETSRTSNSLVVTTNLGILELDSLEWYGLDQEGGRGKLRSKAQVLLTECWPTNNVPCDADAVKRSGWDALKRKSAADSSHGSPEGYPCCREDELPRRRLQPCGHRQRHRSTCVGNPGGSESDHGQNYQSALQELPQP